MSTTVQVSELERRTLSKVKRYMLAYIMFGEICYYMCRVNIGFAQLTMGKDLGLKAEVFGLAAGILALSGFLIQVPAAVLFDKFGAKRWMTFNMVAWGLVVMGQAFVHSGVQLTIMRFFLGCFEAGFQPAAIICISIWFRGKDHGVATSSMQIALGISGILGGPYAGWVLGKHFLGLVGWRTLFLTEGAFVVVGALIMMRIINDDPSKTSWLKTDERNFMSKYLSEYQAEKGRHGAIVTSGMSSVLKDSRVLMLILSYTCMGWTTATFTFFNPTLLKMAGHAVSNQYVGFLTMGPFVCNAVVGYLWGRHGDKTGERHWHTVLASLVTALGIFLYPIAKQSPLLAMIALALVQSGNVAFFVSFWPSCNLVVGRQAIAKSTALINSGTQAGGLIAPIFFGWALDKTGSTNLGMYAGLGVVLLNFVIMNTFFFKYKAQQKALAAKTATASAD